MTVEIEFLKKNPYFLGLSASELETIRKLVGEKTVDRGEMLILEGEIARDLYFVVYVNGHEERPLSEDVLAQMQEQEYNDWLLQQTADSTEYLEWEEAVLTLP